MGGARPYSAVAQLGASGLGSLNRDQDFNAQSEDFPALPGSGNGSSLISKGGNSDQIVGNNANSGENKLGVPGGTTNNGSQVLSQGANNMFSGNVLGDTTQDNAQPSHSLLSGIASSTPHATAVTKEQKFGLMGLLDVIRYTDKDINTLALGTDLTTFGLNLNSSDSLFPSFSSPFTDTAQVPEPQFNTPACYMMHPPSLKSEHLSKFQIETLFYMFYAMPKDILQACASQELYRRDWRYHAELRVWLKPRAPQELMQSHPNVQFVFFDSGAWETRLFTTPHRGNIAAGLLSEEEVRVKAPQPNNSIPLGGGGGGSQ
jgi:CCR4-NOT transcription complex subunit 2